MSDFCGNWSDGKRIYSIEKIKETYSCSFSEKNIGITIGNYLISAQFDLNTESGGIGVYAPIGNGKSYYALYASLSTRDELGSGIIIKRDKSNLFAGEYKVRYFKFADWESPVFNVNITQTDNINIYTGTWATNGNIVYHGIFLAFNDKYAVAYGNPNDTFDIRVLTINIENGKEVLYSRYVKGNSADICERKLFRSF